MKNANIGIVNLVVSDKLKNSYFENQLVNEAREMTSKFFDVVKNSPLLQLEFKVFNNIEGKFIENEVIATRYIDNNIKLFEIYTIEEIDAEREKIQEFLTDAEIPNNSRVDLYQAIDTLITESIQCDDSVDVDKLHESFVAVLTHIQEPKKKAVNEDASEILNEEIIEIAVKKFHEKYSTLDEGDKVLLQKLIKSNDSEKQELLETYKTECLDLLNEVKDEESQAKVKKAIDKIKEMVYNQKNVDDDIIGLHDFKKQLL
jgi:hypothetical protein